MKTQHDALSQEVGKHGARINTRWRSFTSKERAQCLSTINGTKSPQNRKETSCEDIFFDITGVSLRLQDITSDPEVLLRWLECNRISHPTSNEVGKKTILDNLDEVHGTDEELLDSSRSVTLPESELAPGENIHSPCAAQFISPQNQLHMLKFLNEILTRVLKFRFRTGQREERQATEELSTEISRLQVRDASAPHKLEYKEMLSTPAPPKTVNLVTAETFGTIMGKNRARTRVSWNAFERAMGYLGFSVARCSGSAVTFAPEAGAMEKRSITLHRLHNGQTEGYRSLILSRRLGKVYGWVRRPTTASFNFFCSTPIEKASDVQFQVEHKGQKAKNCSG
ncbi:ipa protein [Colletotrichum asianum]|uniref:Ipa protein n=1 Tax=Colletotrichum asianum TaxID=702518 RepID=A0A8H3VRF8_9PEZI|nr:ipa protein [Colletotrichum asianum]